MTLTSPAPSGQPEAFYVNQAEMLIVKPTRRLSPDAGALEPAAEKAMVKETLSASPSQSQPEVPASAAAASFVSPGPDPVKLSPAEDGPAKTSGEAARRWSVENMSIEDVKGILVQLKLTAYVDKFEELQVDGVLLQELNKDVLMKDFGMIFVEATKLRNFVEKGHLPKVSQK